MIVPQFWAESRKQFRDHRRQVTVRRFGWSDVSQEEAQRHADQRVAEALQRILQGEKLRRRELKRGYNAGEGVPIREEIVSRHGEAIVTRNSYGARCLNVANVLFIDVDDDDSPSELLGCLACLIGLIGFGVGWWWGEMFWIGAAIGVASLLVGIALAMATDAAYRWLRGPFEPRLRAKVAAFLDRRHDWNLRLYRTPAGMRLLATHRPFLPDDPEAAECFAALGADPLYVKMCRNQQCFRARVSAKPWRMGMRTHIRPKRGAWPPAPEFAAERHAWIVEYESLAPQYAACRYVESIGSGHTHHQVRWVQKLHDDMCQATSDRELA